ncbi:MAG: protein kinase [Ilumatobacter sp.]|uniref:nSTAND1 domain-containing NTPase n=1 Tax=Ilumatobacter sp. TaxID=1967498 RepID=UPI003C74242E
MTQRDGESVDIEPTERCEATVRVFGEMGVDVLGSPISVGGPRQRRLLALLAIRAGSVVSTDWLEESLWSDDERPDQTTTALRTSVSRLRTALPEVAQGWIETTQGGYTFAAPSEAIEHQRFSLLRAEARRARDLDDPLVALGFLDEALALWRGQPFRELEDLDWARAETEQLGLDRLEMLEERWEVALALGRHTQITGELAVFTSEHTLRDRAARQYALALHRSGRTVEALRVIADHRRVLVDVGGLEPSPAMAELENALLSDDASLRVDKVGRPLRGYRLIEQIGSGAFSVVWRALQPSVEREVAIKQIRPELASQPDFIRRFEAEARIIARIEHPHIVPLIDFWRDPDSAYLVMRWLPGGTLERRLDDGPLSVDQTLLVARQIGAALTAAHAQGVVHRDVKAANVLFDEQGNAFLADFGIALEATQSGGPEAALSQGSPAYAAPEQLRRQPLGPEADVFSLGIVLFEALTGTLPFPSNASLDELVQHQLDDPIPPLSDRRAELPRAIVDAVTKATAKDPRDRFRSVEDFVRALDPSTSETSTAPPRQDRDDTVLPAHPEVSTNDTDIANPYLGLRAFEDGDADRFFGREGLVDELVRRLSGHSVSARCVVVVGPSGSGKSSVVRAGLMPALRAGAVAGSSEWFTTTMVPGTDPFESLEAALLRIAVNPPPSLIEQLRDGPRGILRSIRRCLPSDDDRVVVVIDQFEEIFTGSSALDADGFLDALSVAVDDPSSPLRLIATLRADYYDRPLEHPSFARILSDATVTATPLAPDELERAIIEPARRVGVEFEPGLAARLAAETQGQPSPLPLLQYTLSELFDRRVGTEIPLVAHDEIGGVTGALASRAEALYTEASDAQRRAVRNTFGRMINPGEASADLRRRVPVADLAGDPENDWVTTRYGAARLLTFDRDVTTREPTVEVAHEALLREWPRLAEWLREDADVLRSIDEISVAAAAWDGGGRETTDLYRGGRLENAVGLALAAPERLRWIDNEFIDASRDAGEAQRNNEFKRVRRLRRLVAATAAGLVIALVAGGLALRSQQRAETATEQAETATGQAELATIISRSAAVSDDEPEISVLLALEAHRRQPGQETEQTVLNALASTSATSVVASHGPVFDTACPITETDGLLDFGIADGQFTSVDPLTNTITSLGPAPDPCVYWVPDADLDRRYIRGQDDRSVVMGPFDGSADVEARFDEFVGWFSKPRSAGLALVFLGENAGEVAAIDDATGDELWRRTMIDTTETAEVTTGVTNLDGSRLALGYAMIGATDVTGQVVVFDVDTGDEIVRIDHSVPLPWLMFDDTTNELIAVEQGGSILTIDLETGQVLDTVEATSANFLTVGLQPDGNIIAVSTGQAEVIDRRVGPIGQPIELQNLFQASVRADGLVTTVQADGSVDVIDLTGDALVGSTYEIPKVASTNVSAGIAGVTDRAARWVETIDLATGARSTIDFTTSNGDVLPVDEIFPNATGVWATTPGHIFTRWEDDRMVEYLDLEEGRWVNRGVLYLDRYSYVTEEDGVRSAHLLDFTPGNLSRVMEISVANATATHPTPDGGLYVTDTDGILYTYDAEGTLLGEIETGVGAAFAIAIDPASGRLAIGGVGVVIVDPATGQIDRFRQVGSVSSLGFARSGELLAIGSFDGTVRIWDGQPGNSAALAWRGTEFIEIPFQDDPNADSVWITSGTELLEIPLEPALWMERACEVVGRDFTQDEWELFVPGDEQVQSACP